MSLPLHRLILSYWPSTRLPSTRLPSTRLEEPSAAELPGVTHAAIGVEDDLTHLFRLGLNRQAVGHADVLTVDVVDRGTVSQFEQLRAVLLEVGIAVDEQLVIDGVSGRPLVDALVLALVGLGHRPEGQLVDTVGGGEVDHLLHLVDAVEIALDQHRCQTHGEVELLQLGNQSRQVLVLAVRRVDRLVLAALVVHHRNGDGGEAEVIPLLQVGVGNAAVGNQQAIGLQLADGKLEGLEFFQEAGDLVGEDGGFTLRGDHGRGAAAITGKLRSLAEIAPVDGRLFGADAVGRSHGCDTEWALGVACQRAGDDAEGQDFHRAFLCGYS